MSFIPVILCGGVGSRLWPVSREMHPKPFIQLPDGKTLLQKAFLRAAALEDTHEILTITNRDLFFKIQDELNAVNTRSLSTNFILEPVARNTAAAISAAALQIAKAHGRDAVMLVLAADHLISNESAFQTAVLEATVLAKQGKLVTFGVKPHAPETGYGYIETTGNTVIQFVEKPTLEKAKEYLASGRFLWNSGMFCFTAGTLLDEMEKLAPETLTVIEHCLTQAKIAKGDHHTQLELDATTFNELPDISIDYAVMEKSQQVAVVPCDIGWSDVGSWTALGDLVPADLHGNRILGEVLIEATDNCIIQSPYRLLAAVGVHNLIIIDTPDALLVSDKSSVQEVKKIYSNLKEQGHETHKLHKTVFRPWGTYTVLEEGTGFKIKRIEVNPGGRLSLQQHQHRSEHWVVVSGTAKVTNGDKESILQANESTFIPAGNKHRLENPSKEPIVLIEVQTGSYVGEDDIVRFDDVYGRVT